MIEKLVRLSGTYVILVIFAAVAVVFRLIPHLPNAAPIGALALFIGAYYRNRWSWLVPLLAMLASDYLIGFYDWRIMAAVYGSFILYFLIGALVRKKKNPATIALGSISGSVLFFIITNFAVWLFSGMYPLTSAGLLWCYAMGSPFLKSTIAGDAAYSAMFFGGYALLFKFGVFLKAKTPLFREAAKLADF